MSENRCPLCGKETINKETFCGNCREIAENSYSSILLSKDDTAGKVDSVIETFDIEDNIASESDRKSEIIEEGGNHNQKIANIPTPKAPRSNKKLLIFFAIGLAVSVLVGAIGSYIYLKQKESEELEMAYWNECVEKNTPLDYSKYLVRYPDGKFSQLAQDKIVELRERERKEWEALQKSDDINAFFAFLADYPDTPYASKIKMLMDSLSWLSAKKENTADAYLAYLDNAKLGHLEGQYETEAKEKFDYLSQLKIVEGEDLTDVKSVLKDFFSCLSQKQYKKLEETMTSVLNRYYNEQDVTKESVIKEMEADLKNRKIRTISYAIDTEPSEVIVDNKGVYFIVLPVKEEITYSDKKKKKETRAFVLNMELDDQKKLQAMYIKK